MWKLKTLGTNGHHTKPFYNYFAQLNALKASNLSMMNLKILRYVKEKL